MPAALANRLGLDPIATFAAAGSTQGTATKLTGNAANVTVASANQGIILPNVEAFYAIYNSGPNALSIYPPVGGTIQGAAKNAAIALASGKSCVLYGDGVTVIAILGA
jgi:hypothetical protein